MSYSAVLTLKHVGCQTVLMTTEYPSPESYGLFNLAGRTPLLGLQVATRTKVVRIIGKPAVTGVEVEDLRTGQRRIVDCDTVVLTGDWIPDHELARSTGLDIDPGGTLGPVVDTALRTSRAGVFAIGNLLHPVDTADIAALDGRHVADQVHALLTGNQFSDNAVRILADAPLRWVAPNLVRPPGDPRPPGTASCYGRIDWSASRKSLPAKTAISWGARPSPPGPPRRDGCSASRPASSIASTNAVDR